MFIRRQKMPNGKVRILLVEGYRVDGKVRQRHLKYFGTEDELNKDDPEFVNKLIAKYKNESAKEETIAELTLNLSEKRSQSNIIRNYGNFYLERMYVELGLESLCKEIAFSRDFKFSLNDNLKTLCFMRALCPGSKRNTHKHSLNYFLEDSTIKLEEVYKSLGILYENKEKIVARMHDALCKKYDRQTEILYYDVTNYYFEIDEGDEFRKKGCSKEHRPLPIVQMGLFMDNQGLPVDFYLYPGSQPDCTTLKPSMEKVKQFYKTDRVIITADKGLNNASNFAHILSQGNGYIVSQRIRGAQKALREKVLNEEGWQSHANGSFKLKDFTRTIKIQYPDGSSHNHQQKVVCIWSEKYALKEKYTRDQLLEKIEILASDPSKYKQSCHKGMKKYIEAVQCNSETGEVIQNAKTQTSLNKEKIQADEELDGYYLIVTSETNLSVSDIIKRYRGLWRIEQSFRITKTDLESRPVFVRTQEHIEAHFLTCFITLTLLRMLEIRLHRQYCVRQIIDGLNSALVTKLPKAIYAVNERAEVVDKLDALLGLEFNCAFVKEEKLKAYCQQIVWGKYTTAK